MAREPYADANDLMTAILRQHFQEATAPGEYRSRLDRYAERVAELSRSEFVSGRLYSRFGSDDLDSLRDGQLLAFLLSMPIRRRASADAEEILVGWARTENGKLRDFERMIRDWKERILEETFLEFRQAYECICSLSSGRSIGFEDARNSLQEYFDHLIAVAEGAHASVLREASISEQRLAQIGEWASRLGFAKETGNLPVSLFTDVIYVAESLQTRTLIINGYQKGELTDPPLVSQASNESDWFAETMRQHVGWQVLAAILEELDKIRIPANSPEVYWTEMQKYVTTSRVQGLHPLLVLENPSLPSWVFDWVHPPFETAPSSLPLNVSIDRSCQGFGAQYICSFNDVPVFQGPLPTGVSLLMVRESLQRLEFSQFGGGRYAEVTTREIEGRADIVDLVITWKFRATLRKLPVSLLTYEAEAAQPP